MKEEAITTTKETEAEDNAEENRSLSRFKENGDLYVKFSEAEIERGKIGEEDCLDALGLNLDDSVNWFTGDSGTLDQLYSFDFDKVYRVNVKDLQNICLNGGTLVLKAETPTTDDYLAMVKDEAITGFGGGLDWLIELLEKEDGHDHDNEIEWLKEREKN